MIREIKIENLFHELVCNIKYIVVVSFVLGVVLGAYSFINADKQEPQEYGAYTKLYITKNVDNIVNTEGLNEIIEDEEFEEEVADRIDDTLERVLNTTDFTEENISVFSSDDVLRKVVSDVQVKKKDLSIEEVRSMIYVRGKDYGTNIELNTVGKDEKTVKLICDKIVEYSTERFEQEDFIVETIQGTTSMGTVRVELMDSASDPRDKTAVITQVAENRTVGITSVIKNIIVGMIVGALVCVAYICISFLLKDRVIYANQIEGNTQLTLLSSIGKEEKYNELYSKIIFANSELFSVNFASIAPLKIYKDFGIRFANALGQIGKKILVVEHVAVLDISINDLSIEHKTNYSYAKLCDRQILCRGFLEQTITALKEDFDLVFFICDGIIDKPIANLIDLHVDGTVFLLEQNSVKLSELQKMEQIYTDSNIHIAGVVFYEKR